VYIKLQILFTSPETGNMYSRQFYVLKNYDMLVSEHSLFSAVNISLPIYQR